MFINTAHLSQRAKLEQLLEKIGLEAKDRERVNVCTKFILNNELYANMQLKKINNDIFLVTFKSQYDLTSTMLRFQEHFESPKFKGKIFTLEEFRKWYVKNSDTGRESGRFTYYTDWHGFNIPSYILDTFYAGKFDPLSGKEKAFLKLFEKYKGKKFYIIAGFGKIDPVVLHHETAHGMFYTDEIYRKEATQLIKKMDRKMYNNICKVLHSKGGYHRDVYLDEAHAYILSELEWLDNNGIDIKRLKDIHKQLNKIYQRHAKKHSDSQNGLKQSKKS